MPGVDIKLDFINTSDLDGISEKVKAILSSEQFNDFAYSELKRYLEPYVPSVTLAQSARIESDGLLYPGPYAHFQYVGMLMLSPSTGSAWAEFGETKVYAHPLKELNFKRPGASKEWDTEAMNNIEDDFTQEIQEYIMRSLRGMKQ